MAEDYKTLKQKIEEIKKAAPAGTDYSIINREADSLRKEFLKKYENTKLTEGTEYWRAKALLDMGKLDEALEKANWIIDQGGEFLSEAKLLKVLILLSKDDYQTALKTFQEIEDKVKKNEDYFKALLRLIWATEDIDTEETLCEKFVHENNIPEKYKRYVPYIYENLADIARERGNLKQSQKILQDAIAKLKEKGETTSSLEYSLKKLNLIGTTAPPLEAKYWLNSPALNVNKLRGKILIIDFFAPWCGPCRAVIPHLVKLHDKYKTKDIIIIGYTRLYGTYRDDIRKVENVSPDEEVKLIDEFLKRFKIKYPVAVATDKTVFEAYGVRGIPTIFIIDKDGKIYDFKVGSGNEKVMEDKVKKLLTS
ncbi:MAG: TlpA family protein disulfide reductase [Candidatus Marinimicrobia bacterium]|nr:TlpA family protein disulfide reductase [Candidatus Neomarinimicrobiota bacterium]